MAVIKRQNSRNPDELDLTKLDLAKQSQRPSKKPIHRNGVAAYGKPFDYHGKTTRSFTLQAIAKLLRRSYFNVYALYKKGYMPQPVLTYTSTASGRETPYWITPQVGAIQRMFSRIYYELLSKGVADTFNKTMADEMIADADKALAEFLGTGDTQEKRGFENIAGKYGVVWITRE